MRLVTPSVELTFPVSSKKMLKHIEKIGRKCYQSDHFITDESYVDFIRRIVDNGHHSVTEHMGFTANFVNDRGVSHEEVRHRICAISQESTRYANYAKERFGAEIAVIPPFFFDPMEEQQEVMPPIISMNEPRLDREIDADPIMMNAFDVWFLTCQMAEWGYLTLINQFKRTAQEARSVLPNSLKTEIAITANLREWRHILALRAVGTTGAPHPQMRQVMLPLLKLVHEKMPILFDDLYEKAVNAGLYTKNFGECEINYSEM